jgi:hypothetical protein
MGKVEFPIDIIFLLEDDDTNKMKIGKIVHDIQPGAIEYWSCPKTRAVLEVNGGICKANDLKIGSTCKITNRVIAQEFELSKKYKPEPTQPLPEEYETPSGYDFDLPVYAGESDIFDLWRILQDYHGGQSDPIYAVQSRESRHNISFDELQAIESLLEDIESGKYPDSSYADDMAAENWLPVLRNLITNITLSKRSPEED